jgi:hypothetical protein
MATTSDAERVSRCDRFRPVGDWNLETKLIDTELNAPSRSGRAGRIVGDQKADPATSTNAEINVTGQSEQQV